MKKEHIVYIALGVFALFAGYNIGAAIYSTYLANLVPTPQSTALGGG